MKKIKNLAIAFTLIIFVGTLLYFPLDVFGENYQGLSTGDGIRLVSSPHFELNSFRLALIVDRETNLIQMDFSPRNLNVTKSGNIALVLPYPGTIKESTGWTIENFEHNTVLIKKYQCSDDDPCYAFPREFVNFLVDGKIDSKIDNHHIVSFEIFNSAPPREEYGFILDQKEHREHYDIDFTKLNGGKAIIIIENTAFNLKENPSATYDTFVNTATGYENKQFVWNISEIGFVHAEYDVVIKPSAEPSLQVLVSPEVQEAVGSVWQTYILPVILAIVGTSVGGYFWYRFSRHLKGKLKIEEIEFRKKDLFGQEIINYVTAKISSTREKVIKDIDTKITVEEGENLVKILAVNYRDDEKGKTMQRGTISWDKAVVAWSDSIDFKKKNEKLEQIRKGETKFLRFPDDAGWYIIGQKEEVFERSLDLKDGQKYLVTITIRGTDMDGITVDDRKQVTITASIPTLS